MAQASNYDNVEIYTNTQTSTQDSGFFQPAAPSADGMLASDQARAVAEVQAALVIAQSRPRNELKARDRLLQACQRASLAAGAVYSYPRGGTNVSGASIRLAEVAARTWGNMTYGFRELNRRLGESEVEAFAWDLETNTKVVRQFAVRHKRDAGGGSKDVRTERDIYEVIANHAQRRVRAAILEIIPGDIIEDAVAQCEKTLHSEIGDVHEAAAKLVNVFAEMGVTREAIETRLGHRIDAIQPAQVIGFRKIYTSIKEGMSEPKDWFELERVEVPDKKNQVKDAKKQGKKNQPVPEDAVTPGESATPEQAESVALSDAEQLAESPEPESKEIECPLYGTTVRTNGCPKCNRYGECPHWKS